MVILSVNMAGLMIIFLILRRHIDRALSSTALLRQVESEIDAVITELNRTTERNISLLEEKIRSLGSLLGKADHRLTLMTKHLDQNPQARPIIYTRPSKLTVGASSPKGEDAPYVTPDESAPSELRKPSPSPRVRALNWHRQGVETAVIASRLGITRGEVDLIISLEELEKEQEGPPKGQSSSSSP